MKPIHNTGGIMARKKAETISGYFRKVFQENPKLLDSRSNAELLERWLRDHPDEKEVSNRVKTGLANIKSVLRKKHKRRGRRKAEQPVASAADGAAAPRSTGRRLEHLEEAIDECLTLAKNMDREGLASIIGLLRRARNEVVWKMGE
jgi:hypothetical protein